MKPLLMKPIPDYTIWGCNRISKARNYDKNYGTWWEVSAHPYCTNEIVNMDDPTTLQQVIDENTDDILGPGLTMHESLRLAYLDTQDALSIQVHPYDEYAMKYSNDFGKAESWYILDAVPGATLVAGTKTNDSKVIREALDNGTLEEYLNYVPVKKGDYIVIPAGMLHALGKDILAIEVGTNSNTTYRFYDYNRKDANGNGRPLHLKESFDVADFNLQPTFCPAREETHVIGDTPEFKVQEIYADGDVQIKVKKSYFVITNITDGIAQIKWEDEVLEIPCYSSVFVPYSAKEITVLKGSHVLYSRPGLK